MGATILLDFLSDPMGGLLTSARAFLNRVRRFDSKSRLVVLEVNAAVSRSVADTAALEWVNLVRPDGLRGWRRVAWQNLELPALARRLNADSYVSLSHYLPATLPRGIRSIIGVSNLAPFSSDAYAAEQDLRRRLRLRILRTTILSAAQRADKVIALSQACRTELISRGIAENKISVIPNGVALEPSTGTERALSSALADGEFILSVSHFHRYKNYERLVGAYSRLADDLRARYKLILVGAPQDPGYVASLRALIAYHEMGGSVRLIEGAYGEELTALYRNCAAFVFPSLVENSPITLLEAMAHGVPVAASDIPSMREMGGDAAIYFDPHSEEAIATAIALTLSDDGLRERLRALGPKRARLFDWDQFSEDLVRLYREGE